MCMSPRRTAKGLFAVRSSQRRTAKYLPPIYLKCGKLWKLSKYISGELLATAAKFRILVNRFVVHRYEGPRQRYTCRVTVLCREFFVHFAVTYSLPCALLIV